MVIVKNSEETEQKGLVFKRPILLYIDKEYDEVVNFWYSKISETYNLDLVGLKSLAEALDLLANANKTTVAILLNPSNNEDVKSFITATREKGFPYPIFAASGDEVTDSQLLQAGCTNKLDWSVREPGPLEQVGSIIWNILAENFCYKFEGGQFVSPG